MSAKETDAFNAAYDLGVAAERERCAKIADSYAAKAERDYNVSIVASQIATSIRQR